MILPVKVSVTEEGTRLGRWLMRHYGDANMIAVRKMCRSGEIRINSKRCTPDNILIAGDVIRIPPMITNGRPGIEKKQIEHKITFSLEELEKLRKVIIHNDEDIVVFNKPAGLAVQGGGGIKKSLDKMAAALFPNDTVLLVHRLDKETSGIIVVAKNQIAAQKLAYDFQTKNVHKEYLALLAGNVSQKSGTITEQINGKGAVTEYSVIGELKDHLTFVRFLPQTGRKHQLRIHAAFALGTPIVGDDLYGSRSDIGGMKSFLSPGHLYLFAQKISFRHPRTNKILTIKANAPEWMRSVATLCEIEL
jgi:23S rRNA pseudouridine955/2504/2580 synthase